MKVGAVLAALRRVTRTEERGGARLDGVGVRVTGA